MGISSICPRPEICKVGFIWKTWKVIMETLLYYMFFGVFFFFFKEIKLGSYVVTVVRQSLLWGWKLSGTTRVLVMFAFPNFIGIDFVIRKRKKLTLLHEESQCNEPNPVMLRVNRCEVILMSWFVEILVQPSRSSSSMLKRRHQGLCLLLVKEHLLWVWLPTSSETLWLRSGHWKQEHWCWQIKEFALLTSLIRFVGKYCISNKKLWMLCQGFY